MIKKGYVCMFHKDCSKCANRNLCISASGITNEPRQYLLHNKGYRIKKTEAMQQGIIKHELYQTGMLSALKYPFHILRRDLYSGRELVFKEFQVCSPYHGLRGVVDVLRIKYNKENNTMDIEVEEIKSGYWKKYFHQLAVYGIILSDLSFLFVQEVTKRKTRRITHKFYPDEKFKLNITVTLQVFAKEPIKIPWMKNNMLTDWANGITTSIFNKAKILRPLHKLGVYWLNELPPCKGCKPEMCGYYEQFCSKFAFREVVKTKQMYWGKNFDKKMLIKTKPRVNLSELKGMVKIK